MKPGAYMEVKPSYDRMGLAEYPARAVIFTQMLASGTAQPLRLYQITQPEQGTALFGAGSVGQQMVRAWKKGNRITEVWAIACEDHAEGQAATGSFAITGPATAAGPVAVYINEVRIPVAVLVGTTAAQIATSLAAAMTLMPDLPVTAQAANGTLTLTAKHKGEVGNGNDLAVGRLVGDFIPEGVGITVAPMTGGATNPDVEDALDVIAGQWFTDWVLPWDDANNFAKLSGELAARYQAMGKLDAHAHVGCRGAFSSLLTKGGLTNSPFISLCGAKNSPSPPWVWAATQAAVATFQLTNDPSRQLRGLVLPGVKAPDEQDLFEETEQNLLLKGGMSTFSRLADGTVSLDRVVTTYKRSTLNVEDRAWLDIMVPKTCSRIRYDWNAYVDLTYPRAKLADDNSRAANADSSGVVVTPKKLKGSWAARCALYEIRAWIERVQETLQRARFERDGDNRTRVNARQPIVIIGNLMNLMGSLEFEV